MGLADAEAALGTKALRYGRDDHYDVISAFIKSIRGSDPDAGLYWLARMLESGEDARFIARRLVILASEDIGRADSTSLLVADAAARAVEFVGLPEAQLNLAHAVVHLATAPKSNRVTVALGRARADVAERAPGEVPDHLRDAHYRAAAGLGHGQGYQYPHDDPRGWVPQQYRPGELDANVYYEPSSHGDEAALVTGRPTRRGRGVGPARWPGPGRRRGVVVSAGDLAAVILSVVMVAVVAAMAVAVASLLRSLRELRATLDRLQADTVPLMGELRDTVSAAGAEVERVDGLLDSAEAISARVDGASRLGYLAFRAPVIRAMAFGRGVGRGWRRLAGRDPAPAKVRAR